MSSELTSRVDDTARGEIPSWSEDALTARARAIWSACDFLPIARGYARGAEAFVQRLEIRAGEQVLDVACGAGNLAIPAARAGATVTGIDIAPNLLAQARLEARAARCAIDFDVGDVESLPYADGRFDTTVTMFGAMFAYRPERAAAELVRVTRPGGRIAMANWVPDGLIADMLRAHTAVVPPAAGVPSPLEWGREETVRRRLGDRVHSLSCTRRTIELRFPFPPAAVTELFATCYGPTVATLAVADPDGASRLRAALTGLFEANNRAEDDTTVLVGEYLDVRGLVA